MPRTASRTSRALIAALGLAVVGCATVRPPAGAVLVPTEHQTRTGPYCVFTGAPIAADAPAIRHLQSLERQLQTSLGVRVPADSEPIRIYILDSDEAFRHFLAFHHPDLPARRAFFLAKGERREVYTYQGERLEEDLRHEATHALLHAACPDLPLWLDEGLAEYFEVEEGRHGRNAEHLARLPQDFADGLEPDLKRLEALRDVRKMTTRDYRESWAWVHYLLDGPPEARAALLGYLADRHSGGPDKGLSRRLALADPHAAERLAAHVESTRLADRAEVRTAQEPAATVRFQDREPDPEPSKRRSLAARFAGLLNFRREPKSSEDRESPRAR